MDLPAICLLWAWEMSAHACAESEPQPPEPSHGFMDAFARIPWRELSQALALIAPIFFATTRVVSAIFYGRFGVQPEEVGFGYADTLGLALYAVVVICIFWFQFFVLCACSVALWEDIGRRWRRLSVRWSDLKRSLESDRKAVVIGWLVHRAGIIATLLLALYLARLTLLVIVCAILLGLFAMERPLQWTPEPESPNASVLAEMRRLFVTRVSYWCLAMSVMLVLGAQFVLAVQDAALVSKGVVRNDPVFAWVSPWRAQRVAVHWIEGDAPGILAGAANDTLMYLGRAGDVAVVYDVTAKQTLRLPSRAVVLSANVSP